MAQTNTLEIRAILWDMDGVLVDTAPFHFQVWKDILKPYGVDLDWELLSQALGMDNAGTLQVFLGERATPELIARIDVAKEAAFRQAIRGHAVLMPGVRTWLDNFHQRGLLQALASSAPPENIAALLDETEIRTCFEAIVSASGLPGKPDPAVFIKAAELLGISPGACLVIEDSVNGVQAANRAGMRCLAVTTSYPASALAAADLVLPGLGDLTETALIAAGFILNKFE